MPVPFENIGYLGLFFLAFIDGANIPFTPIELILGLSGYLVAIGQLQFGFTLLIATVGNLAGHIFIFYVSRKLGRSFFKRYGKFLHIEERHIDQVENFARPFGMLAASVFRLVPGLRAVTSPLLGTLKMKPWKFIVFSTFGIFAWNLIFLLLGFYFGYTFASKISWLIPILIWILAIGLIFACYTWYQSSKRKKL